MDRLLKALADPTRFRVLELLMGEELTQRDLRERLELDKRTVSTHVDSLLASGLVSRRSPRGKCFVVRPEATLTILRAIADLAESLAEDDMRAAAERAERLRDVTLTPPAS